MNPYNFYITPEEYEEAASNGIDRKTMTRRVREFGWNKDRAKTQPMQMKVPAHIRLLAKQNGICRSTFHTRLSQGWSMEDAATTPPATPKEASATRKCKTPNGYADIAKQNGISEGAFYGRLRNGWDIQTAVTRPPMTPRERGLRNKAQDHKRNQWLFPKMVKTWARHFRN